MPERAQNYLSWIMSKSSVDYKLTRVNENKIALVSNVANGEVNLYDIEGAIIADLRLERVDDGQSLFFLHFELEDLERAKTLFEEMLEAHAGMLNTLTHHVLLCCSCGITTTFFANKLNEVAKTLDVAYDFRAQPIEDAKRSGDDFTAVLLAPQVGHQLQAVSEALPHTLVIELPAKIFGSYDANAALRLVVDAVSGAKDAAKSDLRMARDFDHSRCVLAVSYVNRSDEPTLSYRVLDKGEVTLTGMLIRPHFSYYMFSDLMATLSVAGYPASRFDAIGVAMPGMVNNGVLCNRNGDEVRYIDVAGTLAHKWGVPVFVDNNATAAAAGCYVSQKEWDDVAFHAQAVGISECDEGLVIGGLPRAGKAGFAGNLKYLAKSFNLGMSLEEASWRYDGMTRLVACYLEATICAVAPQAIFVWCDLLPDMDVLRGEILKTLPEEAIPALIAVADYDGLTLMGELSLCLQRIG